MPRRIGRPPSSQEPLTKERILETALHFVDRHGMAAMSMRRLASELGVDPMALYHHLPNKQAVIEGIVTLVLDELELPRQRSADWKAQIRSFAGAYLGLARSHPNLVIHLISDTKDAAAIALPASEALFSALEAAGLSNRRIVHAADLIVDYLNGFALAESTGRLGESAERAEIAGLLSQHPDSEFEVTRRVFTKLEGQMISVVEDGLAFILAGIEALANKESEQTS